MICSVFAQSSLYSDSGNPKKGFRKSISTNSNCPSNASIPNHRISLKILSFRVPSLFERPRAIILYPVVSIEAIRWLPKNPVAPVRAVVGLVRSDKTEGFLIMNIINSLFCRNPGTKHMDDLLLYRFLQNIHQLMYLPQLLRDVFFSTPPDHYDQRSNHIQKCIFSRYL